MSTEYDVHQMLFKGTFFALPHTQCPYACCFKSDSEVNDRFFGLFSGADKNMVPRAQMVGETLDRTSVQSDVANDVGTKQLTSNDVDVAREERHHGNGSMTANTQDSLIAYSSGKNASNPIYSSLNGGKKTAFWPDRYSGVKHPHSILPNPPDAPKKPVNVFAFNHLLGPSIEESKNVWFLKDFWNKRLAKPQYRKQDDSNSLHSGSSSPSTEALDNRSLLTDDSRSGSGDSSGDLEYHGGEPYKGGEDHNDGRYLKAGNHYRALGQYEDIPVPQSEVALNMLQGDGKLSKTEDISCPICSKKLKHLYYLRRHMIIHSGIKPFKCHICPRRFSQTGNRNAHMRIHTGEKPFRCDFCEKTFTHASSKRRHTKFCQAL